MTLQTLVVVAIVTVAFVYAAWALAPATTRRRLAATLARHLRGAGATGIRDRLAARFERIAGGTASGCSDCAANVLTPAERRSLQKK
jgi:hypothetical protein